MNKTKITKRADELKEGDVVLGVKGTELTISKAIETEKRVSLSFEGSNRTASLEKHVSITVIQ